MSPSPTPFIIDQNIFPPAQVATIANLLNVVLPLLNTGAAVLLLIMLLFGGFMWITSGGNPEGIKKAQGTITFAIFGLFVVIASFMIVKLITIVFNIQSPF